MHTGNLKWFLGFSLAIHIAALGLSTPLQIDIGDSGAVIKLDMVNSAGANADPTPTPQESPQTAPSPRRESATASAVPSPPPAPTVARARGTSSTTPTATPPPAATPQTAGNAAAGPERRDSDRHIRDTLLELVAENLQYPAIARRRGWQGTVVLQLRIEADGHVSHLRVRDSSGYAVLDRAAMDCLQLASIPQARRWLRGAALEIQLPVEYRLVDS
jgi:protein TonB